MRKVFPDDIYTDERADMTIQGLQVLYINLVLAAERHRLAECPSSPPTWSWCNELQVRADTWGEEFRDFFARDPMPPFTNPPMFSCRCEMCCTIAVSERLCRSIPVCFDIENAQDLGMWGRSALP